MNSLIKEGLRKAVDVMLKIENAMRKLYGIGFSLSDLIKKSIDDSAQFIAELKHKRVKEPDGAFQSACEKELGILQEILKQYDIIS